MTNYPASCSEMTSLKGVFLLNSVFILTAFSLCSVIFVMSIVVCGEKGQRSNVVT